ncbi:hypothetical protein MNBD_GAMMA10-1341 [hydrothermal vent metagenome]|uniref:Uncharacterized protein n=1 Tax=hydrothermal vent metagenome TaxID=652676 RepID=A0A3B0Y2Z6_9ZZZZ
MPNRVSSYNKYFALLIKIILFSSLTWKNQLSHESLHNNDNLVCEKCLVHSY